LISDLIIEINVIFNEIYNLPSLFFIIKDINSNTFIDINEYLSLINDNCLLIKNYEIEKAYHPFTGLVYNHMFLCKFN